MANSDDQRNRTIERSDPSVASGKMPRAERRAQILAVATGVFAESGYATTGLERIAAAAGISRMILYRHFESKADLYGAALDRAAEGLTEATGDRLDERTIRAMLTWAADDPAAFELLFRQARGEPEFAAEADRHAAELVTAVERELLAEATDPRWARWAARLGFTMVVEGIAAWLDVGRPDPEQAIGRIEAAVDAVLTPPSGGRGRNTGTPEVPEVPEGPELRGSVTDPYLADSR